MYQVEIILTPRERQEARILKGLEWGKPFSVPAPEVQIQIRKEKEYARLPTKCSRTH